MTEFLYVAASCTNLGGSVEQTPYDHKERSPIAHFRTYHVASTKNTEKKRSKSFNGCEELLAFTDFP